MPPSKNSPQALATSDTTTMSDSITSDPTLPRSNDSLPARFATGGTFLLACAGDPVTTDIDLQVLCSFGSQDETAFVVTTTKSAKTTVADFDRYCPKTSRPAVGLVDTTSEHQFVPSLFEGTPTIFTPSPDDLERLVLALSELTDRFPPGPASRHLLIRSLTPILASTPPERLSPVLERLKGLRTETGLCLFGIDYTAHDSAVFDAISQVVDGVLWITPAGEGVEIDFQQSSAGTRIRPPARDTDD